jgi:Ca2+-binding RTX toxin-like protein
VATVGEVEGPNYIVATLAGKDPDAGETFTYSIVAGTAPEGLFDIINDKLVLGGFLDFQTAASYNLTIRGIDGSNAFKDVSFKVNVEEAEVEEPNTTPTISGDLTLAGAKGFFDWLSTEDLDAFDADGDGPLTFTVQSTTNGRVADGAGVTITSFTLDDVIDETVRFWHDNTLSRRASFTVTVSDGQPEDGESDPVTLTMDITDVFDAALGESTTGTGADEFLLGTAGNDTLDGGGGEDEIHGKGGSDTYIVDNLNDKVVGGNDTYIVGAGDTVNETFAGSGGKDTVRSKVTFTLSTNVENLVIISTAAHNGTGNASANIITGNAKANALKGLGGGDTLIGGLGKDNLYGGLGNDTFKFVSKSDSRAGANADIIHDFDKAGQGRATIASTSPASMGQGCPTSILRPSPRRGRSVSTMSPGPM